MQITAGNETPEAVTLQPGVAATGNGAVLDIDGFGAALVLISGTFVGTITHEVSMDGTTWYGVKDSPIDGTLGAMTRTAPSQVVVPVAGWNWYRARVSAYTSGNVTVQGRGVVLPFDQRQTQGGASVSPTSMWLPRHDVEVSEGARAGTAINAGSAQFGRFYLEHTKTINRVLFEITTQNGNVDVGIYAADGTNGGPGTRLASSGSTACPAAGLRTIAIPATTLAPGVYWVAMGADGTAAIPIRASTGAPPLSQLASVGPRCRMDVAFPLPATAVINSSGDNMFEIWAAVSGP